MGILADQPGLVPWWTWAILFTLSGVGVLRSPPSLARIALVTLSFASVGAMRHHSRMHCLPPNHILHSTRERPVLARITGTVITTPRVYRQSNPPFDRWSFSADRTVMTVEAETIETRTGMAPVCGHVHAGIHEAALSIAAGDRVELFGRLYRPAPPSNPGQFDWPARARRHGVFVAMSCGREACVRRLAAAPRSTVRAVWRDRQARLRGLLLGDLVHAGGPELTLLDAMVLGRRGAVDRSLNDAFVRSGCAHVLAVSGLHLGILAALVYWLTGVVFGQTRRVCAVVTIAVTLAYAMVVEPRPPVFRAATMTGVYGLALLVHRPPNTLNAIALAALVILGVTPTALFDPGFQLSFVAVLGIIFISPLLT
jgi:competence protein ComEC